MARLVIIMASLPSIHKTSHIRSCCEKGTVLTKSVIYHLVPHAVVEIIFRCYQKIKKQNQLMKGQKEARQEETQRDIRKIDRGQV